MSRHPKLRTALLWTAQVVLCLLFLFAGGIKLVAPLAMLQQGPVALPGTFLRLIGALEVLGGLGLVLPGLFRVRRALTPLAAVGLAGIMAGAVTVSAIWIGAAAAVVPAAVGLVAVAICLGRRDQAPVFMQRRPERSARGMQLASATSHR